MSKLGRPLLIVMLTACAVPVAPPAQLATMERATPLPAGGNAFAVAMGSGGGGVGLPDVAMGGTVNYRRGMWNGSGEMSVSGQAILHRCRACDESTDQPTLLALAGRVGNKLRTSKKTSIITGLGLSASPGAQSMAADVGVIRNLREIGYASARVGAATPYKRAKGLEPKDEVPTTGWLLGAVGLRSRTGFLLEAGVGVVAAGEQPGYLYYALVGVEAQY
jgi:hypothetical protein